VATRPWLRSLSLPARLILLVAAGILPLVAFTLGRQYIEHPNDRAIAAQQALALARTAGSIPASIAAEAVPSATSPPRYALCWTRRGDSPGRRSALG
jgi:hypothetical protein